MAQREDQLDREDYCSVCLDPLKDPVTIPCGHNYCRSCIKHRWDEEDQKKIYSCFKCRQTFRPRPALVKNTTFAYSVEGKTGPQAAPADHCYVGPEDVACDFCTPRKRKATMSCLQCLVSYCEQHLQPHNEVAPLKKHKLVKASTKFQENICAHHDEVMKIFCRTDRQCICYLCSLDEHKNHDTVSAAAEMRTRKEEIGPRRQKIKQEIQDREKHVTVFQQEVEAINRSAEKAVIKTEKLSAELIRLIEGRTSDLTRKIRSQQEIEVSRAKELREKLKQELTELRRRDAELEKLSCTEDQTQFLHNYFLLSPLSKSTVLPKINVRPRRYFEDVTAAVSEARGTAEELLKSYHKEWNKISMTVTEVDVLLPQDPKTRAEFSHYAVHKNDLKLDPNTANMKMVLSEENRKATSVNELQSYSSHSDRFMTRSQVLSRKRLTGRCYWEVQWSGLGVSVAVAYKDIARTGEESIFGNNDMSWVLECVKGNYTFKHGSVKTSIPGPQSSRVGVFLDYKAGILSFYGVSETIALLHRVQTTFTQPLYAGLGVCYRGSTAEFCDTN